MHCASSGARPACRCAPTWPRRRGCARARSPARTPAEEALGRLTEGTGLRGFIAENGTAQVTRGGSAAYTLTPLTVVGTRNRGYAAARTRSATKTETPLRDVPQSVSLVTRELIADQAMQGMGDVVRYLPGITMGQGEGHRDAPTIRGNSSTADFFVDGVRDDAQYFRDLYNVERVEALKGSNAMIFGRGGGGGVLNRVSKEAQWTPTRVVTMEGGSFDHRRGMVDLGQGLGSAVALRFNGMYENSGGFRDQGLAGALRHQPDDGARARHAHHLPGGIRALQRPSLVDRGLRRSTGARRTRTSPPSSATRTPATRGSGCTRWAACWSTARAAGSPCATGRATPATTSSTRTATPAR
jgi:catecholate siderophore receptor